MKTFRLILWFAFASIASISFAQTAASRTALNALVDSRLPTGTGGITAATLRSMFKDVIASDFNTINADAQPISTNLTGLSALTLSSGFLKWNGSIWVFDASNYLTGNQSISFAPTGDVTGSTSGATSLAPVLAIGANKVTNAMRATMAANTIKGNNTAGTANESDLTVSQVNLMLGTFANPMTTAGDIIVGGASGTPTRQAQGGNGTFWGVSGGVAGYYTPSGSGNVSNSGTPTSGQIASWTSSTVIQGVGASTLSDSILGGLASNGFVKRAGANTYSIDTSTYLTGNQSISFTPTGDVSSSGGAGTTSLTPALTVTKINGTSLAGLSTGILKNTTATGVPSIAIAADFPTLNQNTTGSAATLTTGRTIAITGDLTYTSGSFNGSGNVTGTGTLATVNGNVGSFTNANITVNAKGQITAASNGTAGAGDVTQSGTNAFTGTNTTAKNFTTLDNSAPATGTSALALGTNYTLNGLTANYSFTSLSGTSGRSKIHLVGCDGTHTFTWTTAAQRAGDAVGTTTTITPTAGDHTFVFYYDTVTAAYYYTDDQTGPLNLAGGSTVVTGNLPAANVAAGALASGMTATTQSAADNSTKVATTAYADAAVKATAASVNLGNLTGTINIDWSAVPNGGMFRGVLTGNTTFTFSNGADGKTIIVDAAQTGTNTFTVTWPSMKWPGGTAPTMTTGAATSDITTIVDVNATFKGSSVQNVK